MTQDVVVVNAGHGPEKNDKENALNLGILDRRRINRGFAAPVLRSGAGKRDTKSGFISLTRTQDIVYTDSNI